MFNTLFVRLMSVFLTVILIMLALVSFINFINIRDTIINNRLNNLTDAARDIAYLSATSNYYSNMYGINNYNNYIDFRIKQVQDAYNAYIVIVDSSGKIIDNFSRIIVDNVDFAKKLDSNKVLESLKVILQGNEIRRQDLSEGNVVFSVGVPYRVNNDIMGAIFIHTDAQTIRAEYKHLILQNFSIFLIVVSIFGIISALFTKKLIDPLEDIEYAVHQFSEGHYNIRAKESGSIETRRLAKAFNFMGENIESSDRSRKEFVANVSHELRSPVTNINGYINGMLDNTIPKEKFPEYLTIVSKESERLKKLIEDLLDLSRLESASASLKLSDFDINEAIRIIVINRMAEIDKREISLELNFENEECFVFADYNKILQILTNLLDNALKYVSDRTGIIEFYTKGYNGKIIVGIKDNGSGISKEDLPHIFDRFYKADKSRNEKKGTGLGLSICKQICELHNEKIYVIPNENGANIEFTLKVSEQKWRAKNGKKS